MAVPAAVLAPLVAGGDGRRGALWRSPPCPPTSRRRPGSLLVARRWSAATVVAPADAAARVRRQARQRSAAVAAHMITHGRYAGPSGSAASSWPRRGGARRGGPAARSSCSVAGLAVQVALLVYESVFVRAGQDVPLVLTAARLSASSGAAMTETVPRRAADARTRRRAALPADLPLPGARTPRAPAQLPAGRGVGRPRPVRRQGAPAQGAAHTTCWCPPPASTASPPAGCWPTSTRTTCRSARSRATRPTRLARAATAPRARPRSTRSTTRSGSCTRCGAPGRAAAGQWRAGQLGRGARRHRRRGSARRSSRTATTRSCYHVGRPGEDGFAERVLQAWGVDGHNSHTNICSSGARLGYTLWGGYDRPSPDYANAKVILLISSHLEAGHYFNPHAQRIMEGKQAGPSSSCSTPGCPTPRRTPTSGSRPGPAARRRSCWRSRPTCCAPARSTATFLRRWVNWETYLRELPSRTPTRRLRGLLTPC